MMPALPFLAIAAVGLPLLWLLTLPLAGRWHRFGLPLLPVPALLLALVSTSGWQWSLPWLLMDSQWLLDDLRRTFLTLTAVLWSTAGVFALGYLDNRNLKRFLVFWCLTLTGNLGLVIAGDAASFYSFFALMTFASYGLVVHEGTDEAFRAGRVYMAMAVVGEMLLLAGLMLAAEEADSLLLTELADAVVTAPQAQLIIGLLITGFGVKAGLPLLHFWLPLAHPVAPTPASAVLSGAMIKAGLLGWVLTLPLGLATPGDWGDLMVVAGAAASLGGALAGVCQRKTKAVLAYSSISQMGLMMLLVGAALATPDRAAVIVPIIGLYALHHGLAKGALFLSTAVHPPAAGPVRWAYWLLLALPGFSLAGLPWTSGALAKLAMKEALASDHLTMVTATWLSPLMTAGAVATLLLILRFLWLHHKQAEPAANPPWRTAGWLLTVAGSGLVFWVLPWQAGELVEQPYWLPKAYQYPALLAPIGLALTAGFLAALLVRRAPAVPPGDLLALWPARRPASGTVRAQPAPAGRALQRWSDKVSALSVGADTRLRSGGLLALAILVLLVTLINQVS
ncbi:Formate hydrogenlyase subunit 3/Multisubunit Na+/H+ antiporter, MnhD subunit [Marinobacter segnicrescens]|uniref:Formate hydrogenlyase subunit 3/Multisubunit Na+/H+ antiporter, MnhD subunit n=1 Tax=Marinobacter segnicrescens TaxID=430453 RepID=A0A1I0E8L5_9GAMM|nr:complex I subunit 5 family protein [Marinobacter segnicrescens]SET41529.1 Formate hydrogenlyase subunit 3/Multisubunit Na+/H+ antiporter, MnhD subunit [Marinobacter segnicrescens]